MTHEQAIKRWKELGVERCEMKFSCGGDSMDDYSFHLYDKDDKEIEDADLNDYFDSNIWSNVQFYEASDGYYIGESGTVEITLNEEDDEGESFFDYCKCSQSEWSETCTNTIGVKLTPEQIAFIEKNVRNINGSQDEIVVNFKRDFILTDKETELLEELEATIEEEVRSFSPDLEGEDSLQDWYTFNTNVDAEDEDEGNNLTIKDGELQVQVRNQYYTYTDGD